MGLGVSTNNYGELWAIGMVLTNVARRGTATSSRRTCSVILTDSSYVCGCLVDGWNAKGPNGPLVQALLPLLRESPIHWTIAWIPGHAGVSENEAVDMARPHAERVPAAPDVDLQNWKIEVRTFNLT